MSNVRPPPLLLLAAWFVVTAARASTQVEARVRNAESEHAKPGVLGSLGKTSDGWSGAIPVYMELKGGIKHGDYRHARVRIVTPVGETFYTPMAWSDRVGRFEGTINIGSWYGNGCADPNLGAFAVTVQLDDRPDFTSIDFFNPVGAPFTTFESRRWNGVPAQTHCFDTEFLPTWNVDHWDYRIHDFSVYTPWGGPKMQFNVAVAIPFYPTTARITNLAVTFDGIAVPPGTAASTNDCWWWDAATHALYLQKAAIPKGGRYTVALDFDSDTDLFATRVDAIVNSGMGVVGQCLNGFVFANRYIHTAMAGGAHELAGNQVATHARDSVAENDVNIDCAERVAVPVDDVMLADASGKYDLHIKWRQDEWKDCIVSEDNTSIVVRVHSDATPVTGWAQQLTNNIAVQRTQTYSAGKRYIKNVYTLTNKGRQPRKFPLVWGREQYIGIDGPGNDKGRYAGDIADRFTECKVPIASLPEPWFTAYDTRLLAAIGVIFQKNDPADHGYFLYHTPLRDLKEWPLAVDTQRVDSTRNTCTFFDKVYDAVAPGASVSFTFWMWGGDFSSWDEIQAAISADAREVNGLAGTPAGADTKPAPASSPLLVAIAAGRLDQVKLLLDQGADVNARDGYGNTALLKAADRDVLDDAAKGMLDLLLAKGADVNAKDRDGNTALMRAADAGKLQLDVIRFLADKGADVDAKDRYGYTSLMKAPLVVVKLLAEKGADVDARDENDKTLLMKAVWNKSPVELVKVLLDHGADMKLRDKDGKTPLMLAADRVNTWDWKIEVVKVLAEKGADVDARDAEGRTPLMKVAAAKAPLDLAKVLMAHGADVNAKDKAGKTPLMWAAGHGQQAVVDWLKQHGAVE
jgi:ankyrin repeat protein